MKLLRVIADFMIGWHQGGQIRHRHAELVWQARYDRWRKASRRRPEEPT